MSISKAINSKSDLIFKQTREKKYNVYMCMPPKGTQVTNRLEGSHYQTDENKPFVLSGTVGETWVVDANKLAKTYTFADGCEITPEALNSRMKNGIIDWIKLTTKQIGMDINFAAHLPLSVTNYPVPTSWGDILYANRDGVSHGNGDFLVCTSINGQPNYDDMWVVNGEIFPSTYDMRAFPGLGSGVNRETPVPKSIMTTISNKKTEAQNIKNNKIKYIVNALRSKGDTIGRINNQSDDVCSFNVNNGRYGIILYINTGDPIDGSDSVSIMYLNNNEWTEAATWFLDDYTMEQNIDKIHGIVGGNNSIDTIMKNVDKHLHDTPDKDYIFSNYKISMQQPTFFKNLLKTYDRVKEKLLLHDSNGSLVTQTGEEPRHWRIDFVSDFYPEAILFIDVEDGEIIPCVQLDNGYHEESKFNTTVDGYKQTFMWIAKQIDSLRKGSI